MSGAVEDGLVVVSSDGTDGVTDGIDGIGIDGTATDGIGTAGSGFGGLWRG